MKMNPEDMMPETGPASRAWNEREFVAKQIARAAGRIWERLPDRSGFGFKDKMHFRYLAKQALAAKKMWDAYRAYTDSNAAAEEKAK